MVSKQDNPNKRIIKVVEELPRCREKGMTAAQFAEYFRQGGFNEIFDWLMAFSHGISYLNGWYHDPHSGAEIEPPERFGLMHSEISEALEADRKGLMDEKLPHRLGVEVELADALHRILDYAGRHRLDLAGAYFEKAIYNATRADHKPENRVADGGKSF